MTRFVTTATAGAESAHDPERQMTSEAVSEPFLTPLFKDIHPVLGRLWLSPIICIQHISTTLSPPLHETAHALFEGLRLDALGSPPVCHMCAGRAARAAGDSSDPHCEHAPAGFPRKEKKEK